MLKILHKIKQATQFDLDSILNFFFYFLLGLGLGFIIAESMTREIFCDWPDYYQTDD